MTDLEALEQFVCENDELAQLEEQLGRFNIFDALGIARTEIRHSNFLAWLLDPAESHGQGELFLKALLMDLLRQTAPHLRPFSPVELEGEALAGVEIRREWQHLDLLITCRQPRFVIAIENKIDSGEGRSQLTRYREVVLKEFAEAGRGRMMFVFLTPAGKAPSVGSRTDWVPYSYADLHRVLTRVRRINATGLGDDVMAFLDHYLRLIGGRLMNDPKLDALCHRIYQTHRQAIDIIIERVGAQGSSAVRAITEEIESREEWKLVNRTGKIVAFVPAAWDALMPPVGARKSFPRNVWLVFALTIRSKKCSFSVSLWPTRDPHIRERVLQRLTADPKEFGLRIFSEKIVGTKWTTICRELVMQWQVENEPDEEELRVATGRKLDELSPRVTGITRALEDLFAS